MFSDYLVMIMEGTAILFMIVLSVEAFLDRKNNKSTKSKFCRLCLVLTLLALMIDAESYAFDGNLQLQGLTFFCNMMSFACGSWIITAFMFYVTAILDEKQRTSYSHAYIVLVLGISESIIAIVGAFLGKTFTYIDACYEPGPWISFLSGFQMIFIAYLTVYIIANRKILGRRDTIVLLIYIGFTIITTLMEMAFEDLPSFYFVGQALSMNIIYVEDRIKLREDLSIQKEMQRRLEEAYSMAQSANRAKTTFLNNMSHDIRTPMNAIIGYTGLAASHIDDKEQVKDYLEKIGQSSKHLLSLINDVLDMSRIESGKMSLEEKEENLSEIADTLSNIIQADIGSKDLMFTVDTIGLKNENVMCDKLRLNQVLLNVLSNSIKYTPAGGMVSLQIIQNGVTDNGCGSYEFRIKDNGMGMSEEFLETVFDPFTRVKSSTVSGIQGTGLGMSITKNIVDMMGGTIDISSKEGEGTEVLINLDFKLADEHDEPSDGDGDRFNFTGKKLLLVEDNEMNREIATEILEEAGFTVDAADDGSVAVEIMKNAAPDKYDLILMDIQMPIMDGYHATKEIRGLSNGTENIPIIAMTANAFEEDREKALEAGMNEHVAKPVDITILKEAIAKFI